MMLVRKKISYQIKCRLPRCIYPLLIQYGYIKKFGRLCNFINPKTFNEKIQWSKLHRNMEFLSEYTDKIKVRDYVKNKIGEEYLVPVIGEVYRSADEIDFENLPNRFVIKANHGCGYNLIVSDKCELNLKEARKKLDAWLNHNIAFETFELQYKDISPMLYIEKNLCFGDIKDLPDYKFFCFNGKAFCSYIRTNYVHGYSNGYLAFLDRDYNIMPYYREGYMPITKQPDKPKNYDKMVEIAEKLSEGFSHVRVDLYNVDGKIYFGEMTFSTCGGFGKFVPNEFDRILGKQWELDSGI